MGNKGLPLLGENRLESVENQFDGKQGLIDLENLTIRLT